MLQSIADVMRETVREVDIPCRYGGEEFLIILTNTPRSGALITAERLRSAVEEMEVDGLKVTISIGVACFPHTDVDDFEKFIELADAQLYRAKDEGRNRVCSG